MALAGGLLLPGIIGAIWFYIYGRTFVGRINRGRFEASREGIKVFWFGPGGAVTAFVLMSLICAASVGKSSLKDGRLELATRPRLETYPLALALGVGGYDALSQDEMEAIRVLSARDPDLLAMVTNLRKIDQERTALLWRLIRLSAGPTFTPAPNPSPTAGASSSTPPG